MKNIILSLLFFTITFSVFSQEGFQDSFAQKYGIKQYEDVKTKMFISKVVEAEGKSQKDLMTLFKNWASISFVNLKEVIVSETDNQIVLVYVTTIPFITKILLSTYKEEIGLYVRLVAEFKDGKIRMSLYDDGNVNVPSSYSSYTRITSPGVNARSYYMVDILAKLISSEFEFGYTKPESEKDFMKPKYRNYPFTLKYQKDLEATLSSAIEGIKNPQVSTPKRKDDF